jgi:hypothetical protein
VENENLTKILLSLQKKNEKLNFKEFLNNMKSENSNNNTIDVLNLTSTAQKQTEVKKAHTSVKKYLEELKNKKHEIDKNSTDAIVPMQEIRQEHQDYK